MNGKVVCRRVEEAFRQVERDVRERERERGTVYGNPEVLAFRKNGKRENKG